MAELRTRFAASPAPLRLGRARLALVAWLAARSAGGRFVLRLSGDAPPPDLAWLGIEADTTQHLADAEQRTAEAVARLKESGRLYPCLESEEELRWRRQQRLRQHKPPVYDRAMLKLTPEQLASAEAGGKRPYWRFRLSDAEIGWRDRVAGPQSVKLTAESDPIVVAADGGVAAPLAAAIADARDGITLLVRDAGQLESSGIHLDMLAALGGDPARLTLAHLPRLPPAMETVPLRRLRQDGVVPDALATLLADPDAPTARTLAELSHSFAWETAGRGTRAVGMARLGALNRAALAQLGFEAAAPHLPRGADAAFWEAIRGGIDLLSDARHWWEVVGDDFLPPVLDGTVLDESALESALASLPPSPWTPAACRDWLDGLAGGPGLRLVLTGEEAGPDLALLLPLIGRERVERRLRLAQRSPRDR